MKLSAVRANGPALFMQLLGRGYIDSQGHLRRFITTHYGATLHGITQAILNPGFVASGSLLAPALHPGHRRLHHGLCGCLRDIAQADFGQQLDVEGLVRNVIPYLASGVGAPVESTRLSLAV